LELLECLLDPGDSAPPTATTTAAGGQSDATHVRVGPAGLGQYVALRYLLSDATQRLVSVVPGILRVLSRGPHEDPGDSGSHDVSDGRIPAGLIDWSGTVIRRMASGGQQSGVVMRRPEIQRDLPENRLLRFLLLEIERRARTALQSGAVPDAALRARLLRLATRAAALAGHPLLRTVPPGASRAGHRDAARSPLTEYRTVARAYELHRSLWGDKHGDALFDTMREYVRTRITRAQLASLVVFSRIFAAAADRYNGLPVSVRPLAAQGGVVGVIRSADATFDLTLSKTVLPSRASHVPSTAIRVSGTADGSTRVLIVGAIPLGDEPSSDVQRELCELLEAHIRGVWPDAPGTLERVIVDCASDRPAVTRLVGAQHDTYMVPLAALPEVLPFAPTT
jgi:hypothetical protein